MFVLADGENATAVGARTAAARMLSLVIFILEQCKLIYALVLFLMENDERRSAISASALCSCSVKSSSGDFAECVSADVTFGGHPHLAELRGLCWWFIMLLLRAGNWQLRWRLRPEAC